MLSLYTEGLVKAISILDEVIAVMKETGKDLSADYKETAKGGLAKIHKF